MTDAPSPRPRPAVVIRAPDSRLRKKIGVSAKSVLSAERTSAAARAAGALLGDAVAEISERLQTIEKLARQRETGDRAVIAAHAHAIRSLAGSFGRDHLGRIANCLFDYIDNTPGDDVLDPNLLTLLVIAGRQTFNAPNDESDLADELVMECEAAVRRKIGQNPG